MWPGVVQAVARHEQSIVPLTNVDLVLEPAVLPAEIAAYLAEAERRSSAFRERPAHVCHGFVPSDYQTLYHALHAIRVGNLAPGDRFCEWGSGLGVVASLAAMLGFDAVGIEIESELVAASGDLAREFGIPVEFVQGSFVPPGAERLFDEAYRDSDGSLSLRPDSDTTYEDLELDVDDFDLIFAFPWPNDEELTEELFDRFAANGALLLTYHQPEAIRLRRKLRRAASRRR